jgi:quercetin dioxygenase-like cupin family protein
MAASVTFRPPSGGETLLLGATEYLTDKATGAETEGHYTLFEVSSAKDGGVPFHEHDWDEAFYVLEGEYEISFVDSDDQVQTVSARPGAFVHVPRGAVHSYRNVADGFSKMLSFNQPVGLEPIARKYGLPCAGPGAEPEREPVPVEEFREGFLRMGVRVQAARLEESAVGAWKDGEDS